MSQRKAILNAIRSAQRHTGPRPDPQEIVAAAAALVADPTPVQPAFDTSALLDRFVAKATSERVTASVTKVPDMAQVPGAVQDYLAQQNLPARATVQPCPDLTTLDWAGIAQQPSLDQDGGIAVTLAEYAIAETGSVVFRSGPHGPVLMNFLPLHHIVVLRSATLLAHTEDLWPRLGGANAPQSRLLTLVTGTSGTADIEAKNVRGAHGPRFMHIVIVTAGR